MSSDQPLAKATIHTEPNDLAHRIYMKGPTTIRGPILFRQAHMGCQTTSSDQTLTKAAKHTKRFCLNTGHAKHELQHSGCITPLGLQDTHEKAGYNS
jgi:hypothetical protein